jgi:hypothetical protein
MGCRWLASCPPQGSLLSFGWLVPLLLAPPVAKRDFVSDGKIVRKLCATSCRMSVCASLLFR